MLRRRRSDRAPKRPRRRIKKLRLTLLLALIGLCSLTAFGFGFTTAIARDLPSLDPANAGTKVASKQNGYIYARDGKTILAVLRGDEARIVVTADKIAPIMKQATVAVEDRRFFEHQGVDLRGIFRAVWADVSSKGVVQGGSTITQQLVKNTYIEPELTVSRKLKEAALAWQLERSWSKERILTAYLNTIYFGNNAYGVEMAADVYFDKHASELTLPEAALLAGITQNPTAYNPVAHPKRAEQRRNTVLALMFGQGLITQEQYERASDAPLPAAEDVGLPGTRGPAQYFAEYVKAQLIPYYGSGKVLGGGLKIYTTIDLGLQRLAQAAIDKWLHRWTPGKDGMRAALVAIDPRDGQVLAMVGGTSFSKSQFNLATDGERQPGSSFKPFVLATALAQGVSPATVFPSKPTVISLGDQLWAVRNYENSYLGQADLTQATIVSDNTVYAQLTAQLGAESVRKMARRLGIQSTLNDYLGIGLGVEAVNPLEMARAYATFANGGVRVDGSLLGNKPRAILAVEDPANERTDFNKAVGKRVLDANQAAMLTSILSRVVSEGTGRRAALDDRPVAGKTGTTENYGDAWFVGYTPQLAVAVWVGYPNQLRFMTTQFNGDAVAGGTYPAMIFKTFMKTALADLDEPPESFPEPSYGYGVPVNVTLRQGELEQDNGKCGDVRTMIFFSGYEPPLANCAENEVEVPNVLQAKEEDAVRLLAGQQLSPHVVYRPALPGEPVGVILEQTPAAHALRPAFTEVRLVVAKSKTHVLPKVTGIPVSEARTRLLALGLVPEITWDDDRPAGIVFKQLPAPGVAGGPGMIVRLFVGRWRASSRLGWLRPADQRRRSRRVSPAEQTPRQSSRLGRLRPADQRRRSRRVSRQNSRPGRLRPALSAASPYRPLRKPPAHVR
ncbi:MAG: PBP1A family penicillin-binding protein [Gaiellales bacterium]